jgi:hypothetical protein
MTRRVGLKINKAKTEFMMVGNWSYSLELRVSTGTFDQTSSTEDLGSLTTLKILKLVEHQLGKVVLDWSKSG